MDSCCRFWSARALAAVVLTCGAGAIGQTSTLTVGPAKQPERVSGVETASSDKRHAPAAYRAVEDLAGATAWKLANPVAPGGGSAPAPRGPGAADNCGAANTVGEGTFAYDLAGAANDWAGTCGATASAQDVWYRYVAGTSNPTTVSTCDQTAGDSVLSILDECGGPQVLCLDDFCALQTQVEFAAVAGEDYLIRIADFAGGVHAGSIVISQAGPCELTPPGAGTPEGEACGSDINGGCNSTPPAFGAIACGEVISGTAWADNGVRDTDWYQLNVGAPIQITVTGQAQFPLQLFIISNSCPANILASGSAPRCGTASVTAAVGGSCLIFVGNVGFDDNPCGKDNNYWIQVTTCTPLKPVANDFCAMATEVEEGTFAYDLAGATNDWPGTCGATNVSPDVWFRYTASFTGTVVVSTCGLTTGDSVISVLAECEGPEILCRDDFCGLQTEVAFAVVTGEDYSIRMAGFAGGVHAGQFSIGELQPCLLTPPRPGRPEDEECGSEVNGGCNSQPPVFGTITCGEVVIGTARAENGTRDTDWYNLALDGPHSLTISGQAQFPLQIFVLDDNCPPAIIGAASAPRCSFAVLNVLVAGSARIFVGSTDFDGYPCGPDNNNYWISVDDCVPVAGPNNDDCADALDISGPGPHAFDTTLATRDGPADCMAFGTPEIDADVWFDWTSNCTAGQEAIVSTCGSTGVDTKIVVYQGDQCLGQQLACNDDAPSCGLQSAARFLAQAGGVYKIRIGTFPGAAPGAGAFIVQCAQPCAGVNPDPNGISEGEPCGEDTNGGCNSIPNRWFDVHCDAIVNATAWAANGTRDTDWYRMTAPASGVVSVSITTEIPVVIFGLTPNCPPTVIGISDAGECETGSLTVSGLAPGAEVWIFIAPGAGFDGQPCQRPQGNDYVAHFNIGVPCPSPCPCNFHGDAVLNTTDFFEFLTCFFGSDCPEGQDADYNNSGEVNSQDFFDFLACFFAPPPGCP